MRKLMTSLFCLLASSGFAQLSETVKNYNLAQRRLLLQTSGLYLFAANQGALDLDSAMAIAADSYHLPASLVYDEGFYQGVDAPGFRLINQNKIGQARQLLAGLKPGERILLLLRIGAWYVFRPGARSDDLSEAYKHFLQARNLCISSGNREFLNECMNLLAVYHLQNGDMRESKSLFDQIVASTRQSGDELAIAAALANKGTYLTNDDPEKEDALKEAIIIYQRLGKGEKENEMLMKLLGIHFRQFKIDLTRQELLQSLALHRKIGLKHLHYTETTIAFVESVTARLDQALIHALNSIKSMNATQDYGMEDLLYMRVANIYAYLGRDDESIKIYKLILSKGKSADKTGLWYKSILGTFEALMSQGKPRETLKFVDDVKKFPPVSLFDKMYVERYTANAYWELGNLKAADRHYLSMARAADQLLAHPATSLDASPDVCLLYASMALHYARTARPKQSEIFIQKSKAIPHYRRNSVALALELAQSKNDSTRKDFFSSLSHFQRYAYLNDSVINARKTKEISELQVRFETARKEQDIKNLEIRSELQRAELEKSELVRQFTIGGIVLLLVVVGLLYNRYRLKQRTNIELAALIDEKESLLNDKEWLIKEIHHRVKNNLQIAISLMNIQSRYLNDAVALDAITEIQSRMNAMSLIHQKLYQSSSVVFIDMSSYIKELTDYLVETYGGESRISFVYDVVSVDLDVSQAVPVGLILNEAVTNSIKYAFDNAPDPEIMISLQHLDSDYMQLLIRDNGAGVDDLVNMKDGTSIGVTLMHILARQLGGKLYLMNDNGLKLTINFKKEAIVAPRAIYA